MVAYANAVTAVFTLRVSFFFATASFTKNGLTFAMIAYATVSTAVFTYTVVFYRAVTACAKNI